MNAIAEHTPLEVLLNDSIMKHFDLEFINECRSELAQLRATITEQARQLEEARNVMMAFFAGAGARQMRAWLASHPEPAEPQP